MSWLDSYNVAGVPSGSFRSIAGYASESLVVGRALLCGYNLFVKAWRDAKYDAVLDVHGVLFRIEVKGTAGEDNFSTSSGGRAGQQISRDVESRERPLSVEDCDWLVATTSKNGHCWLIPIELIEILGVKQLRLAQIEKYKEKWQIFVSQNPHVKPYLKSGYRHLTLDKIKEIAVAVGIDVSIGNTPFTFDESSARAKRFVLSEKDRLVVEIWEKVFSSLEPVAGS